MWLQNERMAERWIPLAVMRWTNPKIRRKGRGSFDAPSCRIKLLKIPKESKGVRRIEIDSRSFSIVNRNWDRRGRDSLEIDLIEETICLRIGRFFE
jgi:hypothetical protein